MDSYLQLILYRGQREPCGNPDLGVYFGGNSSGMTLSLSDAPNAYMVPRKPMSTYTDTTGTVGIVNL